MKTLWAVWSFLGSLASMVGLAVSLWVLRKERDIEREVTELKTEEEQWHEGKV